MTNARLAEALDKKYTPEEIAGWNEAYVLPLDNFMIIEEAARKYAAMEALLKDAKGWEPIENAPRDGDTYLCYERVDAKPDMTGVNLFSPKEWVNKCPPFATHFKPLDTPDTCVITKIKQILEGK